MRKRRKGDGCLAIKNARSVGRVREDTTFLDRALEGLFDRGALLRRKRERVRLLPTVLSPYMALCGIVGKDVELRINRFFRHSLQDVPLHPLERRAGHDGDRKAARELEYFVEDFCRGRREAVGERVVHVEDKSLDVSQIGQVRLGQAWPSRTWPILVFLLHLAGFAQVQEERDHCDDDNADDEVFEIIFDTGNCLAEQIAAEDESAAPDEST